MGALMSLLAKARAIIAELPVAEVRLASFQHVCSVDIAENAARLEYEEGLTRDEADRRALGARGYSSWPALADTHPERTRRQLGRLPPPSSEHGHRLLGLTCEFLDTPHWQAAVALGWSLIELFGINPHAPLTVPQSEKRGDERPTRDFDTDEETSTFTEFLRLEPMQNTRPTRRTAIFGTTFSTGTSRNG